MKYHVPIIAFLSLATSVCAEESSDLGISPVPKQVLPMGSMEPPGLSGGKFTPFADRVPAAAMHKRQTTCATSGSYMCANSNTCCYVGYDCESDGVQNWCCPIGELCSGSASCPADHTDCGPITGGDGCCPTATSICYYQSSTNRYGCLENGGSGGSGGSSGGGSGGSSGSGTCSRSGYFPCSDGSGCCPNGTTCVSGKDYCQKDCERGETECVGGCCPSGYSCDAVRESCIRNSGGGGESTARESTSSRARRTSSTTPIPTPTGTSDFDFSEETPSSTDEGSTTSTRASNTRSTVPTNTVAQVISGNGGSGVRVPVVFGLMIIGLFAVVRL